MLREKNQKKKDLLERPKRLFLIVSIVPHNKRYLIMDLLENLEVNYHVSFFGKACVTEKIKAMFGLYDNNRDVVLSIAREDKVKEGLALIEDKVLNYKLGGVAFAIPFDSIIGVKNYLFCANLGRTKNGK